MASCTEQLRLEQVSLYLGFLDYSLGGTVCLKQAGETQLTESELIEAGCGWYDKNGNFHFEAPVLQMKVSQDVDVFLSGISKDVFAQSLCLGKIIVLKMRILCRPIYMSKYVGLLSRASTENQTHTYRVKTEKLFHS